MQHEIGAGETGKLLYRLCWMVAIAVLIMVIGALRATSWVSATLIFAAFAALTLWPVDAFVRDHVPSSLRWLGHVAAMLAMMLVFSLFLGGIVLAARQIVVGLPQYGETFQAWYDSWSRWIDLSGLMREEGAGRLIDPIVSFASTIVQSIWNGVGILSLIIFLVLLMLLEASALEEKTRAMVTRRQKRLYHSLVFAVATRVRWYLVVRTALGALTGLLYALWSWWWGLDFIFVWALLAFLLNYIPTVGSLVAGVLPIGFAFLQLSPPTAFLYAAGLLIIEQVMGNYVDPKLQGEQLALSPLVILIALMFWSWVWGIFGALLAVPLTLVIMIVCAQIPALRPVALLFSDSKDLEQLKNVARL